MQYMIKGLYISGHLQILEFPTKHLMGKTEHHPLISNQKGLISTNFIVILSHKWSGSWLLTACHKYNCCSELSFLLNTGHQTSVPISLWLCLSQHRWAPPATITRLWVIPTKLLMEKNDSEVIQWNSIKPKRSENTCSRQPSHQQTAMVSKRYSSWRLVLVTMPMGDITGRSMTTLAVMRFVGNAGISHASQSALTFPWTWLEDGQSEVWHSTAKQNKAQEHLKDGYEICQLRRFKAELLHYARGTKDKNR